MISPGRDWNSKYIINQLIRTKDFSLLHHLLRNPPPSHLLHKSLNPSPPLLHKPPFPSPFPHSTLSLTSYAIHSAPLTQSTLPLNCYTIHPSPHLLHNTPLPSPHVLHNPPLPCLTPLSHWQSPHRQVPSPLHTSASDELSLGKHKFHSWCTFTVERLKNSLWS